LLIHANSRAGTGTDLITLMKRGFRSLCCFSLFSYQRNLKRYGGINLNVEFWVLLMIPLNICLVWYMDTFPKNDVILFFRKHVCALVLGLELGLSGNTFSVNVIRAGTRSAQ